MMGKRLFFFIGTFICLTAKTALAQPCPDASKRYSFTHAGHSYYVISEAHTFSEAQTCAADLNGHLVYIDDAAEQTAVYSAISAAGVNSTYTTVPDGGGIAYVWIGGTDAQTEGDWKWGTNGTSFWSGQGAAGAGGGSAVGGAYYNWGGTATGTPNEPDNFGGIQDAAAIALASWPSGAPTPYGVAGEWNDINPANTIYYIVEIEGTVGVNNTPAEQQLKVYPNPAKDQVTIALGTDKTNASVALINLSGQKVMERQTADNELTLNVAQIPSGVYVIAIEKGAIHSYEKIVVVH